MTAKELVADVLARLPDTATLDQIEFEIHALSEIEKGEADFAAGRTVPHENVKQQIERWL